MSISFSKAFVDEGSHTAEQQLYTHTIKHCYLT